MLGYFFREDYCARSILITDEISPYGPPKDIPIPIITK
jgi:hypothetical protein